MVLSEILDTNMTFVRPKGRKHGSPHKLCGEICDCSWPPNAIGSPTQEPPPSPFWQLTRTWSESCRGGNSDHGLSFLFSTDLQYF